MVKIVYVFLALTAVGVGILWKCCCCCNKDKILIVPPEDAYWGPGNVKPDDESIRPFSIKISDKVRLTVQV